MAFAVYGSLIPLEPRPLTLEAAIARFCEVHWLDLGVASRADLVANLLLFLPIGFFVTGALRADRRGRLGLAAAVALTAAFGASLSLAIEFTQVYFPARTVSLNDIAAETTGAVLGALAWALLGQAATDVVRDFSTTRERGGFAQRALQLYAAALVAAQLMPLDVTIDLGELAAKARAGRISPVPFSHAYESPVEAVWDLGVDVLLYAPVGALALLRGSAGVGRRAVFQAALRGTAVALAVEGMQIFVYTRSADTTDVLTGALGALLGAAAAARLGASEAPRMPIPGPGAPLLRPDILAAALAWVAVIACIAWWPFEFRTDRAFVKERLLSMKRVPFAALYAGSDYHAFVEISRKLCLGLFLGLLFRGAVRGPRTAAGERIAGAAVVFASACALGAVEVGQIFAPARTPDATDVLVGVLGAALGAWGAQRWGEVANGPATAYPTGQDERLARERDPGA